MTKLSNKIADETWQDRAREYREWIEQNVKSTVEEVFEWGLTGQALVVDCLATKAWLDGEWHTGYANNDDHAVQDWIDWVISNGGEKYMKLSYDFKDNNDAMRFKLTFSGTLEI